MKTLEELKVELLKDGIIDKDEALMLEKRLFEDGKIDSEEAEFLFEINNAVSGKANDASWKDLFIKAISLYLLDDENSPNEIDEEETEWLYNKIKGDGNIDETEKDLLLTLKSRAKMFPSRLEELL